MCVCIYIHIYIYIYCYIDGSFIGTKHCSFEISRVSSPTTLEQHFISNFETSSFLYSLFKQ